MHKKQMNKIMNGYVKAYNAMDVPGMISCLHSDFVLHNVTGGHYNLPVNGKEEFEALAVQTLTLFKSRKQTIKEVVYDGDTAKANVNYEGILAVDMNGFGVAGDHIEFSGKSEFVFKDDLIHIMVDIS